MYAIAGTRDTFDFRVMAAVLAAGDGAVASGRCAAALFDLRRIRCDVPEVTVSGRKAPRLGGALDDVPVRKLASLGAVERVVTRALGLRVPGAVLLAELVEERRRGKKPWATGLEDELLEVFRVYGLPEPERQFELLLPNGGKAIFDAAYPELLLGFEADGDASHKGLLDHMRDEARDGRARLIGWTIKRYSTEDIRERPAGIADEVLRLRREAEAA